MVVVVVMTRGGLESVGDVEVEVEAQCAELWRRGRKVGMLAGLIGELTKVRQTRMYDATSAASS